MELNRDQIVKALECCASSSFEDCDNCPIDEQKKDNCECGRYLAIQALALIRELTEENEKLGIENFDLICELSRIKEKTVRKMQERLKERAMPVTGGKGFEGVNCMATNLIIDQIAKEMLEEE